MKFASRLSFVARVQGNDRRHWHTGLMIACALLLTACGQSGPLYHPGEESPYGPPHYSIFHHPATTVKTDVSQPSPSPSEDGGQKSSQKTVN